MCVYLQFMCTYLDEAVVKEEAYKAGLFAGGCIPHGVPHDVLRTRALVSIVANLEARGRAQRRTSWR
jgi:hypothetical protein